MAVESLGQLESESLERDGLVFAGLGDAALRERFPEHVGQKTHEDVGLDALRFLVPDGTDAQVAFVDAKRSFGLGELGIGAPQFFGAPVGHVSTLT